MITSCSSNRIIALGSARRTDVSKTYVLRAELCLPDAADFEVAKA
jgi:hypothetical protein